MWAGRPEYVTKLKQSKCSKKVLLYVIEPVTLSYIRAEVAEYTKFNGTYPEYIDMPEHIWNDFQKLFVSKDIAKTFMGIPVRKV